MDNSTTSQFDAAIAEFTRMIEMDQQSVRALLGRAVAQIGQMREIAEGIHRVENAGFELMKLRRFAMKDLEKVLEIDPNNPVAVEQLKALKEL